MKNRTQTRFTIQTEVLTALVLVTVTAVLLLSGCGSPNSEQAASPRPGAPEATSAPRPAMNGPNSPTPPPGMDPRFDKNTQNQPVSSQEVKNEQSRQHHEAQTFEWSCYQKGGTPLLRQGGQSICYRELPITLLPLQVHQVHPLGPNMNFLPPVKRVFPGDRIEISVDGSWGKGLRCSEVDFNGIKKRTKKILENGLFPAGLVGSINGQMFLIGENFQMNVNQEGDLRIGLNIPSTVGQYCARSIFKRAVIQRCENQNAQIVPCF